MYFEAGYSKTSISQLLGVSKGFVVSWTQSRHQDTDQDRRGWPKGRGRIWDADTRARIGRIHAWLSTHPQEFYTGATAIQQLYRQRYPDSPVPPLRTVGRMLKELGLSQPHRPKMKGAAKYLCYPEHTVYATLGQRVLEADFIGRKYLQGRSEPVNFIGFSFKKAPKLRYFQRVPAQTTDALLGASETFFHSFEYPDVMKVDNCQAALGSGSGKRSLSRFMVFLLTRQILPVFAVPRKPFSQASIEGNNSVFSRKFWNQRRFTSLGEVDTQLNWFNEASRVYTGYEVGAQRHRASKPSFIPRVYFIRQVKEATATGTGYIEVMNETVPVRQAYINYFVLAEWNLNTEELNVLFEQNEQSTVIQTMEFPINPNSKFRVN